MKNLAKSLVVAGAMAVAGTASADWFDCFCPVIGIDYYQVWMKAKNGFSNFAAKNYPGGTIYVGAKFADCLGFEIGYDTSTNKSRNWTVPAGTFGAATSVTGTTKIRRSGGHIDLIGYMPIDCFDCVELFGSIGYGWVEPKITVTTSSVVDPFGGAIATTSGKGRSVLRLGAGINYMLSECIGVRAKIGYESTSSIRVNGNANFVNNTTLTNKPFRGSATLALGAFLKF